MHRTTSIFVLLALCVGLCLGAAALEEMAVGEYHALDGGYSIVATNADIERGVAFFVLVDEEGRAVDEKVVICGETFNLNDGEFFHFEATLESVFHSDYTTRV